MWICSECDTKNNDADTLCACCGAPRPAPGKAPSPSSDQNTQYRYVYKKPDKAPSGSRYSYRQESSREPQSRKAPPSPAKPAPGPASAPSGSPAGPAAAKAPASSPAAPARRSRYLYEKVLWYWYALLALYVLLLIPDTKPYPSEFLESDAVMLALVLLAAVPAALSFMARPAPSGKKAAPVFHGVALTLEIIWLIVGVIVVAAEFPNGECLQAAAATIPHVILVSRLFRDR